MMQTKSDILSSVESYIADFFEQQIDKQFVYHNIEHTEQVVTACLDIASNVEELSAHDLELLQLAAWFHDTGYDKGYLDHEERSCNYARQFLGAQDYPEEDIQLILGCIRATKLPQNPQSILEEIICDADLSHLGDDSYWDRCGRVRQELLLTRDIMMTEEEWVDFELDFLTNHAYHSEAAQELYDKRKQKHIRQLRKQKLRLNPKWAALVEDTVFAKKKKKKKKKKKAIPGGARELKQLNLGRGVETMYRTTYRTHVNLSSIADNKANIMLSINAIIISIIVSNLVPRFTDSPHLAVPTAILLAVCLTALVYAILSTRPKITEGKFTREDIKNKRSNLLFFGNFYNMPMDDFHWGMMEMIKDTDFLYSSMTRDLYYLGIVLAKKYRYLRICYGIFMYGLIFSVIAFGVAFLLK
ncbi:MAG: Pycsar system effector family protein [Bacteroidota bacterium]